MQSSPPSSQPESPVAQDATSKGSTQGASPTDSFSLWDSSEKYPGSVSVTTQTSARGNCNGTKRRAVSLGPLLTFAHRVSHFVYASFEGLFVSFVRISRHASKHCEDHWTLELLSCLVAVTCLVAIISILGSYQGVPLPLWPSWLSINTVVSILTVVLRASMLLAVGGGKPTDKICFFSFALSRRQCLS
jgi:hypothetical protein